MNDYDYAEWQAQKAEDARSEVAHLVGDACGWCGEPMENPVIVNKGTIHEDYACAGECEDVCTFRGYDDDQEDFRADWDGRWSPEPEWDDATGERIW